MESLHEKMVGQSKRHDELAKLVAGLQKADGKSEAGSETSGSTRTFHTRDGKSNPYERPHDRALALAGGWVPETPR